ncbi:hypothetical protein LTR70_005756 [Exophiala xenobiotica]|uniref:F-box domain-containing protein n=1 Tax=Lithohypha guttulata TaxID=1690604 RepID=A0ABR0K904_9EURO|nr:hypothetical protein LTR24_005493 [Lithohypha guttulata]KAK5317650.1 hypothetical protein LTR70_005756 [Exophiala xenobiotica]
MPNNDKLPPEVLRQILEEVNILDLSSFKYPPDLDGSTGNGRRECNSATFTSVVEDYARGEKSGVKSSVKAYFDRPEAPRAKPIAILNAMRVCTYWRNMVFSILYKEDVSSWKWTAEDWTGAGDYAHAWTDELACAYHQEERCEEVGWGIVGAG